MEVAEIGDRDKIVSEVVNDLGIGNGPPLHLSCFSSSDNQAQIHPIVNDERRKL